MIYRALNRLADLGPKPLAYLYIVLAAAMGMIAVLLAPATGLRLVCWFVLGAWLGPIALFIIALVLLLVWSFVTDGQSQ